MIIRTIQEANQVICCPCALPECADPRIECESYGFSFDCFFAPYDWDEADPYKRFLKKTVEYTYQNQYTTGGDSYERAEYIKTEYEANYENDPCGYYDESVTSTVYERNDQPSIPTDTTYNASSSSVRGGACTGTQTFVDALDPSNNYTTSYSSCTPLDLNENETWTRAGYVFTLVEPVGTDITLTSVVTYSDELTLEWATDTITAIPFPETPQGSNCESVVSTPEIFPDTVDYIQKSRYRFGVPEDYSTEEAPRSTWEMTWDEITASLVWWSWYDGGMIGDEPAGGPTLVASKSWIWGGDMESPWSDWNELPIPEDLNYATRFANILTTCWKSNRHGNKPTETGDQIAL